MFRRGVVRRCAATSAASPVGKRPLLVITNTSGFTHKATRRVDELNLVAYEWQHEETGAVYYHIDTNDRNSTFCIGFRTPAENSKGTTHVLEHTVLCGSKKYPVRDPFFMMLRRSLSNFMNAMTGADYTLYPFATTNAQDFRNLLDVYLDAVFHPLLREEDFKQEGHRVEVEANAAKGKRLVYNGVVYNEMRGVVSEPSQHYAHSLMKVMLPGTHYEHISGGYPPNVLSLTYEELVEFHKRHYHPSNSITLTYGEQSPEPWMAMLNEYFSSFAKGEVITVPTLRPEDRFVQPKQVTLQGPLNSMGNPQRQKRVSVSFGVQQEDNKLEDMVDLSVLDSLLSSGPSSPLYQALVESQIGSRYAPMRGYSSYLSSPFVSYGVEGVDEARPNVEEEVLTAIVSTLQKVQKEGFDQRRVQSVIFQEELQQRHRAADYGVNLCTGLCAMGLCRAANNPLDFIDWLPHLRRLGEKQAASLLPRISKNLLSNPHRATVSVSANKDYLNSLRDTINEMENKLNEGVTEATKDKIEQETANWLERVRAPQNGDILPTLTVKDIPRESFQEPPPRLAKCSDGSSLYTIASPTNGLVYVHGLAPFSSSLMASVRGDGGGVLADVPLWHSLLGNLGAGPYSFKELSIATELVCGGFTFSPQLNQSYCQKSEYIAGTAYGFYTTKEKLREALELLKVALLEPRTSAESDEVRGRALSLAKARCSGVIQRLQHQGNRIATTLASSRLTRSGAVKEEWSGLAQSTHASALLENLQNNDEAVVRNAIAGVLDAHNVFAKSLVSNICRGIIWATCEERHRDEVETMLAAFLREFPTLPSEAAVAASTRLSFAAMERPSSLLQLHNKLPIDTSYVGLAIANGLDWSHPDQAPLRVACQLLSNEYLHRRVREEGGAYGSGASATLKGEVGGVTMSSYRDPTPEQTVTVFQEAASWLSDAGNVTQMRVDEAKLRIFSSLDAPYSADSYGESFFLHDVRHEQKQAMRNALLEVEPKDVVNAAQYLNMSGGVEAVVGVLCPEEATREE
ncbi:putative pitrilysin-like metalloprotease, putative,metallo-peptidase, Clan ME, Family M16C [Trypanosoma grayi]|uniref:putative pitrilysin-like metalloprotease, putative,metallo-peptidase, Clan ME, Family M16C n=1 Tax=Trypanosoma grayi TaxID=71804 RepID=UPI0004F428EE|nr:putative pitrilysin-like metalloprotease, putative,metallo-peptidase, Clan ME, Family M16C [Trypanosoma grayi]KEG13340.1 putative pitrilysin-like metalloprotease, putative,metallo-peptidase, Clan ME, Family M16C [Trypanosoma grayi]